MRERTHFEHEIAALLRHPAPARQFDVAPPSHPPTLGFEFDVHYGFLADVLADAGVAMPANSATVTTHTWGTDHFKVKRDGPRIEIATKPFGTNQAGEKELNECMANIAKFTKALRQGCGAAKPRNITVAGVTGRPRPFPLPSGGPLVVVKLPLNKQFGDSCSVWASPQATLTLPIWKVGDLVRAIRASEGKGAGVALTGSRGQRLGVRSDAIYRALDAVTRVRTQMIKDGLVVKALKGKPLTEQAFSERLAGFLILLASYLIASELPYRFEFSAPEGLRDYEPFAKAYLPMNVKAPFPDIFEHLLFPEDQDLFKELFADGPARARLFALAKPGATVADGANKLFPKGPQELGKDSVHVRQEAEFGTVPTWNDLVEHTLSAAHKGWGSRLLVPISNQIPLDKTRPRFAVELRRIGFAAVFDTQWPGLVRRILKLQRSLG